MKHIIYTPAAAARPLLNRVRHILGLRQESDRTYRGMVGLMLLILLMLSPLALALLQDQSSEIRDQSAESAQNAEFVPDSDHFAPEKVASSPENVVSSSEIVVQSSENVFSSTEKVVSSPENVSSYQVNREPRPENVPLNSADVSPSSVNVFSSQENVPLNPVDVPPRQEILISSPENVPLNPNQHVFSDQIAQSSAQETSPAVLFQRYQVLEDTSESQQPASKTAKLFPIDNALQLFEMPELAMYLRQRIPESMITLTKRNAILVSGTEQVLEQMTLAMAEFDTIVESEEFKKTKLLNAEPETTIKVFKLKRARADMLMSLLMNLQIDRRLLISCEPESNSLIVKASDKAMTQVEELLKEIDSEPAPPQQTNPPIQQLYPQQPYGYAPNTGTAYYPPQMYGQPQPQPQTSPEARNPYVTDPKVLWPVPITPSASSPDIRPIPPAKSSTPPSPTPSMPVDATAPQPTPEHSANTPNQIAPLYRYGTHIPTPSQNMPLPHFSPVPASPHSPMVVPPEARYHYMTAAPTGGQAVNPMTGSHLVNVMPTPAEPVEETEAQPKDAATQAN